MSDMAIRVENLSKRYRIGLEEAQPDTLAGAALAWLKAPFANFSGLRKLSTFDENDEADDVIWALRDVSFDVEQGTVIGIIGHNGAGKSTLLKLLSRITEPTAGRAVINGRVSSLLEVGTGFHRELTGRENVYLNGTVLGMSRREVDRKFDEIVDFAGVEKFIDTPVKRYSSGMQVRLAFAVAAYLEPEILLIDEVLSVGDAAFQKKCLGKMGDVTREGRTVLFVSHKMGAVASLCSRSLVLSGGRIVFDGPSNEAISYYLGSLGEAAAVSLARRKDRQGNQKLKFTTLRILNEAGHPVDTIAAGSDITFELEYDVPGGVPLNNVSFYINFYDAMGQILFTLTTKTVNQNFDEVAPNTKIRCTTSDFPLAPGSYWLMLAAKEQGVERLDKVEQAMQLTVTTGDFFGTGRVTPADCGPFMVRHQWELVEGVTEPHESS